MNIHDKKKSGFTLLELVLSITLLSLIVGSVSLFLTVMTRAQTKHQTIAEVESQGMFVMQKITQNIRNAAAIYAPTDGTSASSLSLTVSDISKNQTVFAAPSSAIQIQEGGAAAILLTNARVSVSALTFQNLSAPQTRGIIRVTYTLSSVNPNNSPEYVYSKTFVASASLR